MGDTEVCGCAESVALKADLAIEQAKVATLVARLLASTKSFSALDNGLAKWSACECQACGECIEAVCEPWDDARRVFGTVEGGGNGE